MRMIFDLFTSAVGELFPYQNTFRLTHREKITHVFLIGNSQALGVRCENPSDKAVAFESGFDLGERVVRIFYNGAAKDPSTGAELEIFGMPNIRRAAREFLKQGGQIQVLLDHDTPALKDFIAYLAGLNVGTVSVARVSGDWIHSNRASYFIVDDRGYYFQRDQFPDTVGAVFVKDPFMISLIQNFDFVNSFSEPYKATTEFKPRLIFSNAALL